jgi:phage terminase large subunit-like protein
MTRVYRWAAWLLVGVLMATSTAAAKPFDLRTAIERQRAIVEEMETRAAEESLSEFMRQAWKVIHPRRPLQWNWHIDATNEHLEAITWGHLRYFILNGPPRTSKSSGASVFWQPWEWIQQPDLSTLSISSVSRLAMRDAVFSRTIIQSEWYQRRWGHRVRIVGDQNVKTYYRNQSGGSRKALSLDSDVVGEGGDRLLIDDPIDLRQADNPTELQRVNSVWDESLFSRINDPQKSAKVIIMHRVADNDLCGHVKDQHDWTVLQLPMEFESKHRCRTFYHKDDVRYEKDEDTGRRMRVVVKTRKVTYTDPRTAEGELLWPKRFTPVEVQSIKGQGTHVFAAQQQQRPITREGKTIKRSWIRYYAHDLEKPLPKVTDIILSIDPSLKAKQSNDPWVMHAWAKRADLAHYFLLNGDSGRFEYGEALRRINGLYDWLRKMYPKASIVTLIENTAAGPEAIADLRDEIPGVVPQNVDTDKLRRLRVVSPAFESGNVWVPGVAKADGSDYDAGRTPVWVQQAVDQVVMYPNVDHDDIVDTTTQAIRRFMTTASGVTDGGHSSGTSDAAANRF